MATRLLANAQATYNFGKALGQHLNQGTVLLLEGDLGAGKTTLIQGLAAGLGIKETIDSPTFTLINEYPRGRVPLYHMDLYRLEGAAAAQLYPELYWEGMEFEPGIVAIEWAERLRYRPPSYLRLQLTYLSPADSSPAAPAPAQAQISELGEGRRLNLTAVGQALYPALVEAI